jgi:hypothetical protein
VLTGRVAALAAAVGIALMAASGVLFSAAARFTGDFANQPRALVAGGAAAAGIVKLASFVDLVGYLSMGLLAVYFWLRFHDRPLIHLYTAAGFTYVLIGVSGAVILGTVYAVVVGGLWQTLEGIPAALWLFGVATLTLHDKQHVLATILAGVAVLFLLIAGVRMASF